jgi:hypothetical protein
MTGGAIQRRMRVDQGELRAVVIETCLRPEYRSMTVVALLPISTLMLVFAEVAIDAAVFEHIFKVLPTMAVIALQSGVRIFQWKICLSMIEPNAAPRRRRMTVLARTAIRTDMHVIDCMATYTTCWGPGKHVVPVTITASHKTVIACQPKARQVMVKFGLQPVRIRVAAATLPTQSARMGIFLCVASITGVRCVAKRLIRNMAVCTSSAPMGAAQYEVGPSVVK